MQHPTTLRTALGLCAWAVFTVSAGSAHSAEPCGEQICPDGFSCETSEGQICAPCMDGDECPPCEAVEQNYCARASCAADADCGAEMLCGTFTATECSGGGTCSSEEECAPPEPPACSTSEYRQCAFRHELPCDADADCGAGYSCVPTQSCWCNGSAGTPTPSPDGSSPPPATEAPECGCEPTGESHCQVIETPCSTDADCVLGFRCTSNPNGACWVGPDGQSGCTPADPAQLCQPPSAPDSGGVPESGGGSTGGGPAPSDPGSPDGANDGGDDDEAGEAGPSKPPRGHRPRRGRGSSPGGHRPSIPGWGHCSVELAGAAPSPTPWALLGLAAVGLCSVRRRRRH